MNWFLSLFITLLSGLAALFATGWAASLHASWHQLPNREGAVGYLVIFAALIGGVASFIAGLIIARVVATGTDPGFFNAFVWGLGLVVVLTGLFLLVSRASADIPPTLGGHELLLEVEFRLPVGFSPPPAECTVDPVFEPPPTPGLWREWSRAVDPEPADIKMEIRSRRRSPARIPTLPRTTEFDSIHRPTR
jgi:hypothetical protein